MTFFFCVLSWDLVKGGFLYTENQNLDILYGISLLLHCKLYQLYQSYSFHQLYQPKYTGMSDGGKSTKTGEVRGGPTR